MADIFQSLEPEALKITDADLVLWNNVELGITQQELLHQLIEQTPWQQETITLWGKAHLQPRLSAWYGDKNASYSYSGIQLSPIAWSDTLSHIKNRIEHTTGCQFNSLLLNYYRDNKDGMGFHADDEPELGNTPSIASLSLGELRTFVLTHRHDKNVRNVRIPLASGALLLMKGETQKNWKHGIPKETQPCGPRINLTFRFVKH